ncbi:phospholipase D-like domain-containing protein [Sphaerisporangium sp. TRM90804]|uniref:phospholipase D-like domain-containing protein n=1 Tax=Sphaerisporangium sp. TRM90804 TaxID=3031113 RepID=UPI0024480C40|nr:phospholipase D-like domain-containing protein [Sphaerisporangium sp. TRM90804]MDH2424862.1 phospholipase D-like domain-containing protein [Sphaerisporangium sp. TRM90804]
MEYLDAVEHELNSVSPGMRGKLWERTSGNALDTTGGGSASWILQVPGVWGWASPTDIPKGEEKPGVKALLVKIQNNIAKAKRTVDISGFGPPDVIGSPAGPFPDGNFFDAMCTGLKLAAVGAAKDRTRLTVRVLTGVVGVDVTAGPLGFRRALIEKVGPAAAEVIDFRVASMTTRGMSSYNHTKLVIVDGESVIHGGVNWMTNYYIETGPFFSRGFGDSAPVTDLDIALRGPVAASAGRFLDELWKWVHNAPGSQAWVAVGASDKPKDWALYKNLTPADAGNLEVISVGSLGYGIQVRDETSRYVPSPVVRIEQAATGSNNETNTDRDFMTVNPDANALRALVAHAKAKIVLSQQDINGFTGSPLGHALFDVRFLDVLAAKMSSGVKVRIVISNPGRPDYSNIGSLDVAYKSLFDRVRLTTTYDAQAHQILRRNLQLAPFRASNQQTWPDGYKYRLHTKLVCVDDTAFYVGSRNVYPDTTQDHGFFIENTAAAAQLNTEFLDKQWFYSKNAAICDYQW